MTTLEKRRIEEMRECGISYRSIASELGMNLGTVKMYCTRHGLGGKKGSESANIINPSGGCEQCGKRSK